MAVEIQRATRRRRTRAQVDAFAGLPPLRPAQEALLKRWLARHAVEPRWQTLLEIAGRDELELADELRALLLEAGALRVKEQFVGGQWQVERIEWADVPALQAALGLRSAAERDAARDAVQQALRALADAHPWSRPAVQSCQQAGLPLATQQARRGLLDALVLWQQEQRFGMRRDFALQARGHTKGISATEWEWLAVHLPLQDFGIARFAPLLWLGGSLGLGTPAGRIDVGALGFCAVPMPALQQASILAAPRRYWLIENRASFERQAVQAQEGDCVVWLPGQPPGDWLAAMGHVLDLAPAPGAISCDPDPAGIGIALQAGALWSVRGLAWTPERMALADWAAAPTTALNAFDQARLAQLEATCDLPDPLRQLCADLRATGRKAEQEGWV
jgi:hypothetical protein